MELPVLYSSGAFVLSNTGIVNDGWVMDPTILIEPEILEEVLLSYSDGTFDSTILANINAQITSNFVTDLNIYLSSNNLTITSSNIDYYINSIYTQLTTNGSITLDQNILSNIDDTIEVDFLTKLNDLFDTSYQNDLTTLLSTYDFTNLNSLTIDSYIDSIYNQLASTNTIITLDQNILSNIDDSLETTFLNELNNVLDTSYQNDLTTLLSTYDFSGMDSNNIDTYITDIYNQLNGGA